MGSKPDKRSAAAWGLAAKQHGIVSRRQLLDLGFGPRSIEHRVARGRLHLVSRGVYAVGWPYLDQHRRWMAAVVAAGEGASLSHRSAAALWEIGVERAGRIDLSVRRRCLPKRRGLHIHSRPSLPGSRIAQRHGIPLTDPVQTLVDLATELDRIGVERAINDADKRDLVDPDELRSALLNHAGEPGVRLLREVLDRRYFRLSDSDLEIHLRPIAAAAGLPSPQSKQWVNGFEVDFFWPELGLIVETDGLRYHRTPATQARDARRDRAHVLAGMSPLRFTHFEVRHEAERVRRSLAQAAAMLKTRNRL